MNTKLYVGNLPFDITEATLREMFTPYGQVSEVAIPIDRESNRPRGFAFVTMDTKEAIDAAVAGTNGKDVGGRALKVNEARPRESRTF